MENTCIFRQKKGSYKVSLFCRIGLLDIWLSNIWLSGQNNFKGSCLENKVSWRSIVLWSNILKPNSRHANWKKKELKVWWILCMIYFDISCMAPSSQCFLYTTSRTTEVFLTTQQSWFFISIKKNSWNNLSMESFFCSLCP